MQVRVNVDEVVELEYNDGDIKIQVRVLPWDERKAYVLTVIEAMPGSIPTSEDDARLRVAGIELRDAVARAAICGWTGMVDLNGADVPFDKGLIGKLEPYETIADDVMVKAMPDFDKADMARIAAEAKQEAEDEKNSSTSSGPTQS